MPHPFPHSSCVVVADDSALERSRLSKIIRELGLDPVEVADSSLVIEKIRQCGPLLVLMDVVMPSPNGFELCRLLQKDEHLRRVPVVMCSVKATDVDHMWAQRLGVQGYLAKPFDPERARIFLANQVERIRGAIAKSRPAVASPEQVETQNPHV